MAVGYLPHELVVSHAGNRVPPNSTILTSPGPFWPGGLVAAPPTGPAAGTYRHGGPAAGPHQAAPSPGPYLPGAGVAGPR